MSAPQEVVVPKYLQVDEGTLTQQCKSLLPILPSEKGWVATYLHLYHGFWYTTRYLNGVLSVQQNFQSDHSDILLATTPKAGTTWLKALLFTLLNRSRHTPNSNNHPLLKNNPHHLVPFLETNLYVENQDPDLSSFATPRLFSTHIPFGSLPSSVKSTECKIVYLCRNPKDTFISLWHFTNKLRPKEKGVNSLKESLDKFCRGVSLFGSYWDHVLEYWKASLEMPDKVLFVKFEDLKEQPGEQLRRLVRFLECPFSEEEESAGQVEDILRLCSFESLSRLEVNKSGRLSSGEENRAFFRSGVVGDWENHLTQEMMERLDRITEEKLRGSTLRL